MANSHDVILINEDYTIGKILEFVIYTHFYKTNILSFCGFKKFHPHDTQSTIRLAFVEPREVNVIEHILKEASLYAINVLKDITL